MRATRDGWDGERPWDQWPLPAAEVGSYMTVLSAMLRRGFVPLILGYLGCTAVGALVQTPNWLVQGLNAWTQTDPSQASWTLPAVGVISLLSIPLSLAYGIFFTPILVSLQRIARLAVLAPDEIPSLGSALGQVGRRYFPTLGMVVLQFLLVFAGCCLFVLPGIAVLVFLLPASYLVVNGAPLTDSFLASFRLVVANWLLVLIYLVIAIVLGTLWVGCASGVTFGSSLALGPWGPAVSSMGVSLVGYVIGIPIFFFAAALLVTMEAGSYGIEVQVDPDVEI